MGWQLITCSLPLTYDSNTGKSEGIIYLAEICISFHLIFFFFNFFACTPTRDGLWAACTGNKVLTTGPPGKSPFEFL